MNVLCVHLGEKRLGIYFPPQITNLVEVDFINHLKSKWPDLYCHVIRMDDRY